MECVQICSTNDNKSFLKYEKNVKKKNLKKKKLKKKKKKKNKKKKISKKKNLI